jgi:cytochrome c oxidase subunit 4
MRSDMAHEHDQLDAEHKVDHIVPVRVYVAVLSALMILLVLTVIAAFIDFDQRLHIGYFSMSIALLIAITKAVLIILFFMHIKYSSKITAAFAASAFVWLGIMFVLSFSDYMTRKEPHAAEGTGVPVAPSHDIIRPAPRHESVMGPQDPEHQAVARRDLHARAVAAAER